MTMSTKVKVQGSLMTMSTKIEVQGSFMTMSTKVKFQGNLESSNIYLSERDFCASHGNASLA